MRALLLALVLAGCLAPAIPASVAAAPPALALFGCENLSGNFAVPASEARAFLPAGFQPRSADQTGESLFWIVSVRCAASQVEGVDAGEAWFSYGELDVTPPAQWRQPGVSDHTVPVFALAQPQAVVDALAALGLPNAALSHTSVDALPTGGKRVSIESAIGGFAMVGQPTTGSSELGAAEWGMFGVEDRQVVSVIRGFASGGTALSSVLAQTNDGALPLMQLARPATRGGSVGGFDLAFARVG